MTENVIIPILTGTAVIAVGGSVLLARWARRAPVIARLQALSNGGVAVAAPKGGARSLVDVAANIGSAVSHGRTSATLGEQLTQAGYHGENAARIYLGAKVILFVCGLLLSSTFCATTSLETNTKLFIILCSSIVPFFVPNMVVSSHRSRRAREIRVHLADAIDLLEICASAGMGIDMAWNSVTDEVRSVSVTLADEMALTNLEIHLGAQRADAIRHMAQRTGADELSSLVAVLVQSDKFGTSITDALRNFASSMRETRSMIAQELAEKMAIKLIFPMIVFIFPSAVMIMAGPAFISLFKVLSS